jgi:hypothetical protein
MNIGHLWDLDRELKNDVFVCEGVVNLGESI